MNGPADESRMPDREPRRPVIPAGLSEVPANAVLASMELPAQLVEVVAEMAGQLVALGMEDYETGQHGRAGVRATTICAHLSPAMARALVAHLSDLAASFATHVDPDTRAAILTAHDRRST